MAQRTSRHCLAPKAAVCPLIGAGQQDLQCHGNALHLIIGLIDRGNAATAQQALDKVTTNLTTRQVGQTSAIDKFVEGAGVACLTHRIGFLCGYKIACEQPDRGYRRFR